MSMKKKIILNGYLSELYPHVIEVEAESVAEAITSLTQIEELSPLDGHPHQVVIRGVDSEIALFSKTEMQEIHVYPRLGGSGGKQGLGQVLLGIALVAVGFIFPAISLVGGLITSSSLMLTGAVMALGGIIQMLTPMPELDDGSKDKSSNYLGSGGNTVQIGTNIPLAYGHVKLGGHYLSFDVDAKDQAGGVSQTDALANDLSGTLTISRIQFPTTTEETTDLVRFETTAQGVTTTSPSATILVEENVYSVYDQPMVPVCVVVPVYTSATTSPTNIPTSGWT